jgi:hypothetical protein
MLHDSWRGCWRCGCKGLAFFLVHVVLACCVVVLSVLLLLSACIVCCWLRPSCCWLEGKHVG